MAKKESWSQLLCSYMPQIYWNNYIHTFQHFCGQNTFFTSAFSSHHHIIQEIWTRQYDDSPQPLISSSSRFLFTLKIYYLCLQTIHRIICTSSHHPTQNYHNPHLSLPFLSQNQLWFSILSHRWWYRRIKPHKEFTVPYLLHNMYKVSTHKYFFNFTLSLNTNSCKPSLCNTRENVFHNCGG